MPVRINVGLLFLEQRGEGIFYNTTPRFKHSVCGRPAQGPAHPKKFYLSAPFERALFIAAP